MEQEIEEKLEEIYNCFIDVKFRDFCIYDVFLTFKGGQTISVVFNFNNRTTLDGNITNVCQKIDNEIVKLYKKVINVKKI